MLAQVYADMGVRDRSVAVLEQEIDRCPENDQAWWVLLDIASATDHCEALRSIGEYARNWDLRPNADFIRELGARLTISNDRCASYERAVTLQMKREWAAAASEWRRHLTTAKYTRESLLNTCICGLRAGTGASMAPVALHLVEVCGGWCTLEVHLIALLCLVDAQQFPVAAAVAYRLAKIVDHSPIDNILPLFSGIVEGPDGSLSVALILPVDRTEGLDQFRASLQALSRALGSDPTTAGTIEKLLDAANAFEKRTHREQDIMDVSSGF